MLPKPDSCKGCPLYQDGKGFVPDEVIEGATTFVLMQNPGADEEAGQRVTGFAGKRKPLYEKATPAPAIGQTGYVQESTFFPLANLERGTNVSIGNTIRCRWIKNGKRTNELPPTAPLRDSVAHCNAHHLAIPESTVLVVAEGKLAWDFTQGQLDKAEQHKTRLSPAKSKVSEEAEGSYGWRGYLGQNFRYHNRDLPVYGVLHCADLLRDPKMNFVSKSDWFKIPKVLNGTWPRPIPHRDITNDPDEVFKLFNKMVLRASNKRIYCDAEFESYDKPSLIGFAWTHGGAIEGFQVYGDAALQVVGGCLHDHSRRLILTAFNIQAELSVFKYAYNIAPDDWFGIDDPMLAHALLWSELRHDFGLVASLYGEFPKLKHLMKENFFLYNWGDTIELVPMWQKLSRELENDPQVYEVYKTQSIPLVPILMESYERGIQVNKEGVAPALEINKTGMEYAQRIGELYAGFPINLGSGPQTQGLIYGLEKHPVQLSEEKRPTLDKDALNELREHYLHVDSKEELTPETLDQRIQDGGHPFLEALALDKRTRKIYENYLEPLIIKE